MHDATLEAEADALGIVTRRLFRWGHLLQAQAGAGDRVTMSESMALSELALAGTLTQAELGDLLGLEKSTVSRLAQGLQARGWLARERDPANRRFTQLRLTPAGAAAERQIGGQVDRLHAELLAALTAQEREALRAGMAGVLRVLRSGPVPTVASTASEGSVAQ